MLVVALLSPVLGALADYAATKKRILFVFTAVSCVFTGMLFFVEKGDVFSGMLFFILAEIGYRGAQVFYNALLPDIAEPDQMGKVSGNGWAIGSSGPDPDGQRHLCHPVCLPDYRRFLCAGDHARFPVCPRALQTAAPAAGRGLPVRSAEEAERHIPVCPPV
jgi:hypothetical protein